MEHQKSQHKGTKASVVPPKLKKISVYWAVSGQVHIENQLETKHVEGTVIACLDGSSILPGSTIEHVWTAFDNSENPPS